LRDPLDRCRHLVAPAPHPLDQAQEGLARQSRALHHGAELLGALGGLVGDQHVIVERHQIDPPLGQPLQDHGLGLEIEGLVAQMKARVGAQPRAQRRDAGQHAVGIVGAAQARLPRPGHAMEHRGDAVGERLPVAVEERDVHGEVDARPRHHLPLECVAMDVHDAGQHHEAVGLDAPARRRVAADPADQALLGSQMDCGAFQLRADESASALYANVHGFDLPPRCVVAGHAVQVVTAAASCRSRNRSMASRWKSGKAACKRSCVQSHQASRCSRCAMASGKRARMKRAGLPATIP
jgi:hypothetical protein